MVRDLSYFTFVAASIRNKPGRNIATLFCFAFIAANIFSGQFLIAGAAAGVDRGVSRMGADHMVVPSQYMVFLRGAGPDNTVAIVMAEPSNYRIRAGIMEKIRNVTGVSAISPQLYVTTLDMPELSSEPANIYGFDPETDFTIQPWLQKPRENPLRSGEVIVGQGISGEIGSRFSLGCQTYTIVGKLDPTQSFIDHSVVMRLDDAYLLAGTKGIIHPSAPKIIPGEVNAVLIRDVPGEDLDLLTKRLQRIFSSIPEYKYVSVFGRHFSLDPVAEDIQAIPGLLNLISAFVVIVSLPLIALISAMVAHERQQEIGLLKSMGANKKIIFFLVMGESLMLAVAGGIAGVGLSFIALYLMNMQGILNSALQVSFQVPSITETGVMAAMALIVVIVIGTLASLHPAYRSSSMNAYDAIQASV